MHRLWIYTTCADHLFSRSHIHIHHQNLAAIHSLTAKPSVLQISPTWSDDVVCGCRGGPSAAASRAPSHRCPVREQHLKAQYRSEVEEFILLNSYGMALLWTMMAHVRWHNFQKSFPLLIVGRGMQSSTFREAHTNVVERKEENLDESNDAATEEIVQPAKYTKKKTGQSTTTHRHAMNSHRSQKQQNSICTLGSKQKHVG